MAFLSWFQKKVRTAPKQVINQDANAYKPRKKCDRDASENLQINALDDLKNNGSDDGWIIKKKIGEGAFCVIHKIRDKNGKVMALKTHKHTREWKDYSAKEKKFHQRGLDRLEREYRLLSTLDHPGIISVKKGGFCVINPKAHAISYAMEYFPEGDVFDLARYFAKLRSPFPATVACTLFTQMVEALAYLETKNIVHGDLKVDNCLVARPTATSYRFVLSDFGVAIDPKATEGAYVGRPEYTAPEIMHAPATYVPGKSDLWSLWCLLLLLLNVDGYHAICANAEHAMRSRTDLKEYDVVSKHAANAWRNDSRFWYWRGCGRWEVDQRLSPRQVQQMIRALKTPLKEFTNEEIKAAWQLEKLKVKAELKTRTKSPKAEPAASAAENGVPGPKTGKWLFGKI